MSNKTFSMVSGLRPGRSVFDLSYEKKFTCDMGQLIPILADEMVPGDVFSFGNDIVVRFQPLVAPILHEINAYVHYFFIPYRLLWDDWEDFISGGVDGDFADPIPRWYPNNFSKYSLWDYLGFPTVDVIGASPLDFPKRAYNLVYNEYYRDENLVPELDITLNEDIKNRAWEKDYFTAALPWQQRGTAPALPISGVTSATWGPALISGANTLMYDAATNRPKSSADKSFLEANTVDFADAATFDVADLRLAFQIQKWLERNARAGARYTEFLRSHFGVAPRDDRLNRPEYIGGSKSPVIVSEVLQTSSTDGTSPQGNLAGHGLVADGTFVGKYHAQEYGMILGILSIMPRSAYSQGIDRQWLRESKYDFYFPEFANLSEQAIFRCEIYADDGQDDNKKIFGYQGRYDEMRVKRNMVCADMRDTFNYWHLGREFSAAPELNATFITCIPSKRIFAVPTEPGLIVNFRNNIKAIRPLPIVSNPGLIDHF